MKYQDRYVIACPFCEAPVGHACFEKSSFKATGRKIWAPTHRARMTAVENAKITTGDDHYHPVA